MADRAGGEINGLADLKLVFFQRGSPELQLHGLLLLTVLPLDRGEYSSEIGDCLKNSSFEATSIRHSQPLDVLIFIKLLSCDLRADYWFCWATHGRHAPTSLKPASPGNLDGIRKVTANRCGPPLGAFGEDARGSWAPPWFQRGKTKTPRSWLTRLTARTARGRPMRRILGIILGVALTVGGAYVADSAA